MKIMIVDDEPLILSGIENIINNEFFGSMEIVKAFDGIDALDKLKSFIPDLIITDIRMPEMSGLELLEKVSGMEICSRFIMLSGYSDFEYAKQAIKYKALDYILKPIDKAELVELLNRSSKSICQDREKLIKEELNKIRESMLYDVKYEELFINENIINMIFPFPLFMVILIQMDYEYTERDIAIFDTVLQHFFNKYQIFSLHHKRQIIIAANFEQTICESDLYRELAYLKLENQIKMKSIGISRVSDKIDSIYTLFNEASRNLRFREFSSDKRTHEGSNIKEAFSLTDYHDIAAIIESDNDQEIVKKVNDYIDKLLSINSKNTFYLNSVQYIVISDITIYLQSLGLTLDAVFGVNTYFDDEVVDDVQLKNQVQKIIAEISNFLGKIGSRNRYSESVSKMLDYINKNYMKDISLDDVAKNVSLHPNYASSLFKKEIGTSFVQYLNSYRIRKAKDFIKGNAELSLEKIAEMVGYENSCRFIKVFKKYCNITPGEYRNKINSIILANVQ